MKEFSSVKDLEKFYKEFQNKSLKILSDYVGTTYPDIKIALNKGMAGQILEAVIGNAPNSSPNPDVKYINVELKVLPLRNISNKIQPKERSKIKSLNYDKIVKEEWKTSEVRSKMQKILFLLYEHPTGKTFKDWEEFIFKGTLLYEIENENEETVQKDWQKIKSKVESELADTISEGDGEILGACTSGTGILVAYGNGKAAKQRSYSLKHNYLKVFYGEKVEKQKFVTLELKEDIEPQDFVLNEFNLNLKGQNLKYLVDKYQVKFSTQAKSSFSLLINRILKVDDKAKIRNLEEKGITIKTIPVSRKNKPWEAMSFPKFSLVDLIDEEWESDENEAAFKKIITQGFIFIPIIKEKEKYLDNGKTKVKFKDWSTWEIGTPIYWKASDEELFEIKKEWEEAKAIVEEGVQVETVKNGSKFKQKNNLLKSADTKVIHIRPHAKDSRDLDKPYFEFSRNKIEISWQCFWLNKNFIDKIINLEK